MAYDDLRENHDICAMTPWDPYWLINSYVGDMCGSLEVPPGLIFNGPTYDVFVPFCPFGPILQLVAKKNKKEREKYGEMSMYQDFSNWKYVEIVEMSSVVI